MTLERMDSAIGTVLFLLLFPCAFASLAGLGHAGPPTTLEGALSLAPLAIYGLALFTILFPYFRAIETREAEQDWNRASELVRRVELSQRVELRGWVPLIPASLFLATTLWAATSAALDGVWGELGLAAGLAAFGLPFFLRNVPHLDGPLLSLGREGIRTAAYGELRWQEIEGIHLQRITVKGIQFHTLEMLVPTLPARTNRMHPCTRLLHAFRSKRYRDRVVFRLGFACGERPRAIELTSMTLWERVVGNKDPWFANDHSRQHDVQELRRRIAETERRLTGQVEEEMARLGATLPESARRILTRPLPPPKLRDKLERTRPVQNESHRRELARLPVYRFAALVSIALIVGLLVISFRMIEAAQA